MILCHPDSPIIVSLDAQSQIFVDKEQIDLQNRLERFKELAKNSQDGEVYVRGDGSVKYAQMMELMAELGQAGFSRVTLVTDIKAAPTNEAANSAQISK